ncbi:MAG: hypothetical protein J5651_07615 [Salinivirgaceae bacterium]|nr:hypothetical protein [Salinivirgaceae bacterium]
MKGKILLIAMIFISFSAFAQEWQDVLYLKNGSVIRGVLIEQIPNVSVKIQTSDGSVFVYEMGDVEKMAKEQKQKTEKEKKTTEKLKYPNRGYRGILGAVEVLIHGDCYGFSTSTIHGMQINPKIFVGGGLGIQYVEYQSIKYEYATGTTGKGMADGLCIPIFADARFDMMNKNISPFFDLRLGLEFGVVNGLYFSPSIGCRFGHFNMSLGFETKGIETQTITYGKYSGTGTEYNFVPITTVRLGFDIGAR